jgi:hypothetical protein
MKLQLRPIELVALAIAAALGVLIGAADVPANFDPYPPAVTPTVVCPPEFRCPSPNAGRIDRGFLPPDPPPPP